MKIINQYIVKYNMSLAYLSEVEVAGVSRFFIKFTEVVNNSWKEQIKELNAEEAGSLIIV